MIKQASLFLICWLLTYSHLSAQKNKGLIEGYVIDETTKTSIDYATISLFTKKDSTLVSGGITDETGKFSIEAPYGNFFLEIRFLSYKTKSVDFEEVTKKNKNHALGVISLQVGTSILAEVEVLAAKGPVQLNLDKRIYNVGSDITNAGSSALELLDNVPSVTVESGKVNIRGNNDVQILINGKPSALVAGGSEGLKRLQSSTIESVEVITNPSAKYQADGAAGIINFILKKNTKKGFNGSLSSTLTFPFGGDVAVDLNYRKNDLNFFLNYSYKYQNRPAINYYDLKFINNGILELTEMDATQGRIDEDNSIIAGLDYYINDQNIITGSVFFDRDNRKYLAELTYLDFIENKNSQPITTYRSDDQNALLDESEYSLKYKKLFEQKGKSLEFDLRLQQNKEDRNSDFLDVVQNDLSTSERNQRAHNYETSSRWIASIDYSLPFNGGGKLESGYQSSWRRINNDYLVEQLNTNSWEVYRGLDNELKYIENIHSIYSTLSNKKDKFSYQVGLRLEHSDISTELVETDDFNPRKNTWLFPSGNVTYNLPKNQGIKLSYSRRIRRPSFWDLNPFFLLFDYRNFYSGNPNLNPSLTNSFELSHIKYWDKATFTSALYYKYTTGPFSSLTSVDDIGFSSRKPYNLNYRKDIGLEIIATWKPVSNFQLTSNFNFYNTEIDGTNFDSDYLTDGFTWRGRLSPKYIIDNNWTVQSRLNYQAGKPTVQGSMLAFAYMDIGLSRSLFDKKGKLTINVNDLFNSRRTDTIVETENFYIERGYQFYIRRIILNLSYKF